MAQVESGQGSPGSRLNIWGRMKSWWSRDTQAPPAEPRVIKKVMIRYVGGEQGRSRTWGLLRRRMASQRRKRGAGNPSAKSRSIKKLVLRHVEEDQWRSRTWGIILLLVFIAGSIVYVVSLKKTDSFLFEHCATLVALTPSLVALVYLVLIPKRVYDYQFKAVKSFQEFQKNVADSLHGGKSFLLPSQEQSVTRKSEIYRPRTLQYFFSTVLLAIPFLLVAVLSDFINEIRLDPLYKGLEYNAQLQGAIQGLTFAGYGVFVHTLVVMIHRIHAAALSSQFLLTATLRAVVMMTLGFAIGVSGLFRGPEQLASMAAVPSPTAAAPSPMGWIPWSMDEVLSSMGALSSSTGWVPWSMDAIRSPTGALSSSTGAVPPSLVDSSTERLGFFLYFALGAFPSWAYEWLRNWVRRWSKRDVPSDNLSLEYVDGMDDVIIERFEELGIANVQHLATAEPVNLALRTLYPLERIIDWIDQAILITYLRKNILGARKVGIRGAIDMRGVYKAALQSPPGRRGRTAPHPKPDLLESGARARSLLQSLARMISKEDTRLGLAALYNVGANLSNDFHVILLTHLWHHKGASESGMEDPQLRWRKMLIRTIGEALRDCQVQPEDSLALESIPPGSCEEHLRRSARFRSDFSKSLNTRLRCLVMRWEGSVETLVHMRQYDELYKELLRHIVVQPRNVRPKAAPDDGSSSTLN